MFSVLVTTSIFRTKIHSSTSRLSSLTMLRKLGPTSAHVVYESAEVASAAVKALEGKVVGEKPVHASIYEKR